MTAPGEPSEPRASRKVLGVAFLTLFLDLLGFGIIIPIQPFFAESFGAAPAVITLLSASYSLMQLVFAPVWGRLSDRVGRRPVVLVSIAVGACGFLMFGFAHALWMLFAARMIAGFGNANIGTVQAIVADVTAPKDRAKAMGLLGAAFGLGFVFGPVIGGVVGAAFGPNAPAFVAAGLGAVNFVLALVLLPETRKPGVPSPARGLLHLRALGEALALKNLPQLLFIFFIYTTGFALMETSIALFLEHSFVPADVLGSDAGRAQATKLTTIMLAVVGVVGIVVQGMLIGRLKAAFGERTLCVAGCAFVVVGFVVVARSPGLGFMVVLVGAIIISVGSGVVSPSISSLLSRSSPDARQGEFLGLGQSMSALGRIVGPSVSGLLFQTAHGAPLIVGAVLVGIGGLVGLSLRVSRD